MKQLRLLQQLDDYDKHVNFKMMDTMLTKKNLKISFTKNAARFLSKKPWFPEAF